MGYFQQSSPEQEAQIARQALASGDLAHAVYHIGTALVSDPSRQEWLAVLDDAIGRTPDALQLVRPDDNKSDLVTAATRAYVLARQNDLRQAFPLISEVARMAPQAPFLRWAVDWVRVPNLVASLGFPLFKQEVLPKLLGFISQAPSPVPEGDAWRGSVEAANEILAVVRDAFPEEAFALFASSVALRRVGNFEHAVYFATHAFHKQQDWNTCVGVACAHRDAGHPDDAVAWFRHALTIDPDDLSARLDIGDTLLDAERYDEAVAAYEDVLAREPEHAWAQPSIVFARHMQTRDPVGKRELLALAESSSRAWSLFCRLEDALAYHNFLPPVCDATANGVRGIIRQLSSNPQQADGGRVGLKVTHPESPSVLTAFRAWQEAHGVQIAVDLEVERVQQPDPRQPKSQVDFTLFAYDGNIPKPGLPPPDPRCASAIAAIAAEPFHLDMWAPAARDLAAQMGPPWATQIASTMVHPPRLPSPDQDPFEWVQKVQMAAALVLAHLDDGWEPSARKRALFSLALGPVDWTVDAAVAVMAWLGRRDPAIRADVQSLFGWLEGTVPEDGYTCFEYPLACSWLSFEGLDEATRQRLEGWRARIEADRAGGQAGPPEENEEVHGGLTLEQYATMRVKIDAVVAKHGAAGTLGAVFGGGSWPELEAICREHGVDPYAYGGDWSSGAAGRIPEWDQRINDDGWVQEQFMAMQNDARLALHGMGFNSHEGRVAEMIRSGNFDVEGARVNAMAAAQQAEQGGGGDPDPVVFPGQRIERLSHYVGLMKAMQTGDMMGALARYGLDMGSYGTVAQAWGVKLAADPTLTAKFGKMMQ